MTANCIGGDAEGGGRGKEEAGRRWEVLVMSVGVTERSRDCIKKREKKVENLILREQMEVRGKNVRN